MSSNYERTAGSRSRLDPWSIAGWIFLVLLLLFTVIPIAWMISTSLKTQLGALQFPPTWIPANPTLDNYTRLLNPNNELGRTFLRYMGNSLLVATSTTIIGVAVAAIVTAAVMVTMFYLGPWADPPGMDELWWPLSTAAALLASWRWWARRRAT
mgnify:CR=1 FL=1